MAASENSPNPYRELRLSALHEVMNQRAGELLKGRTVSRQDIAYLLLAASKHISPDEGSLGSPTHRVRNGAGLVEAFWPEFERELRAVTHHTFNLAREAAQLSWEDLHRFARLMRERGTPVGWSTNTPEEFEASLQQLQAVQALKASNEH